MVMFHENTKGEGRIMGVVGTSDTEEQEGKTLLIVRAYPNLKLGKPEYDWEFPTNCPTSRMLGILDLIKHDLLTQWKEDVEEE